MIRRTLREEIAAGSINPPIGVYNVSSASVVAKHYRSSSVEATFPLTGMQRGMVFHGLEGGPGVYVQQFVWELDEELDNEAFLRAWRHVHERHAVLRASFGWQDGDLVQQVHCGVPLEVKQEDWGGLSAAEQEGRLSDYLRADRERGFPLELPGMRLALFRLGPSAWRCIWSYHHALLDGRSRLLVSREIFACYEALRQGAAPVLEPRRPFADHVTWLAQRDQAPDEAYWREVLRGFEAPTPLGFAREAGDGPAEIHELWARLSAELTAALGALAESNGLTVNTLLQGAWAVLLSRYSGEADIVFGTTRACRHSGVEGGAGMVGLLINTVPLRVQVQPDRPVVPWLSDLRRRWVEMRDHEHAPLSSIQGWSDVPRGTPLFDTLLVFENAAVEDVLRSQGGVWASRKFRLLERTNYPLALSAYGGRELVLRVQYDTHRVEPAAAARVIGHLRTVLQAFVDDPARRLVDVPLLTAEEWQELVVDANATQADYPRQKCAHELFEQAARRAPEAPAVVFKEVTLSFRELNARANRLARRLRELGVGPDRLVALYLTRSPEMVVGILGVLKAGGAYVPLDPAYPEERLAFMLGDSGAEVLLTQQRLRDRLPPYGGHVLCLDAEPTAALAEEEDLANLATPDSLAYMIYTSGSTGRPKGALIPHRGLVNYLSWAVRAYAAEAGSGAPVQSSISFDLTVTSLLVPLLAGRPAHLLPEEQGVEALGQALAQGENFSLVKITPAHLELLARQIPKKAAAGRTRAFVIGGENLLGETLAFWQEFAPQTALINEYGPTETVVGCCVYWAAPGQRWSGSVPIGRPIANTELYVLDAHRRPVPSGVPGELYIGGDGLARGYLNRPELTAERFVPHPFRAGARLYRTGDRVRRLEDGNLEFLGRLDGQVKIRGYRVEPGEIEAALGRHPDVREAAVQPHDDPAGQKRLVAYVVPRTEGVQAADLRAFLRECLPEYMVPSAFALLPSLPLNANGKVDRKALRPPAFAEAAGEARRPPRDELERRMKQLWEQVLDVGPIGLTDNFFDLGGHSLLAARLFALIEESFGVRLPLGALLRGASVEDLAGLVRDASAIPPPSFLVALQPQGHRPPFFCVHGIGGEILSYQELVRRLGPEQPFYALQAAWWEQKKPAVCIEDMATQYLEEVCALQPEGPYFLGGFSFGGLVAFEMAQQLQARGQQVALLAIGDTRPPGAGRLRNWLHPMTPLRFLTNGYYWVTDELLQTGFGQLWGSASRRLRAAARRLGVLLGLSEPRSRGQDLAAKVFGDLALPARYRKMLEARYEAALKYVPKVYPGRITLIRSRAQALSRVPTYDLGWGKLAGGGLEVSVVPGNHDTIHTEPWVRVLAEHLNAHISKAQALYQRDEPVGVPASTGHGQKAEDAVAPV